MVECDVSQPSFTKKVWVGDESFGFVQDIIIERLPAYCMSCKHLGHSQEKCYISNPSLRPSDQRVKVQGKADMVVAPPGVPASVPVGGSSPLEAGVPNVSEVSVVPVCQEGTVADAPIDTVPFGGSLTAPTLIPTEVGTVADAPIDTVPFGGSVTTPALIPTEVGSLMGSVAPANDLLSPVVGPSVVASPALCSHREDVAVNLQSTDIPSNSNIEVGRVGSSLSADAFTSDGDDFRADERYATDSGEHIMSLPLVEAVSSDGEVGESGFQRVGRKWTGKKANSKRIASTSSIIVTRKGKKSI